MLCHYFLAHCQIRRNVDKETKYVELVIVNDFSQVSEYKSGGDPQKKGCDLLAFLSFLVMLLP